MISQQSDPKLFKQAYLLKRHYYKSECGFILWKDHISVIGGGITHRITRVDIYKDNHSIWYRLDGSEIRQPANLTESFLKWLSSDESVKMFS